MGWCASRKGPCPDTKIKELKPHKSTHGWGDVDGYLVPDGYKFEVAHDLANDSNNYTEWVGQGWHQIHNDDVAEIKKYTH